VIAAAPSVTVAPAAGQLIDLDALAPHARLALTADIVTSFIAALGCASVLWWIARTPGRSLLERRSVPLIATLAAIFGVRCVTWLADRSSDLRWWGFWPSTILPLVMALFVEGLLRRHLPLWLKWFAAGLTALFVAMHVVPQFDNAPALRPVWPIGVAVTMALGARQMWLMRNAGLSREERRLIAGVVFAALLAMPLVAADSGLWEEWFPLRTGGLGGLLFLRALVTPAGRDGLSDAVSGTGRAVVRGLLVAAIVTLVLPGATILEFAVALDLALCLILVFEVLDRLRRRRPSEVETQLLRWLATAPAGDFEAWRRAIRHAPLVADAVVLDGAALGRYDGARLGAVLDQHGPVVSASRLRTLQAQGAGNGAAVEGIEQALDLISVHDATHLGLISTAPLRVIATNLPYVGGRDTELQLRVIVRTGQAAASRGG
jgi:hypothetical protein